MNEIYMKRQNDNVHTPLDLFEEIYDVFGITNDPCPRQGKINSLVDDNCWGESNYVNPPYSNIGAFLAKGLEQFEKFGKTSVFLIPARTHTVYFHQYVFGKATSLWFLKGCVRLKDMIVLYQVHFV